MAASLPVIGVRTPAFLEFLDEGVTAQLVESQDAHQLAELSARSSPIHSAPNGWVNAAQNELSSTVSRIRAERWERLFVPEPGPPVNDRVTAGGEGTETTSGVVTELPVGTDPHGV